MLTNEDDQLVCQGTSLHFVSNVESAKPGGAHWTPWFGGLSTRPSKVSARTSAFGDEVSKTWTCKEIAGPSAELRRTMATLRTIAQTDSAILVFGEKGTCKESVARSLHLLSQYSHFPFIHVNCELARPEEIVAVLTAQTRGSGRPTQAAHGGFHLATGKTIFLEGISRLSSGAQHAILQTLKSDGWEAHEASTLVPKRIRLIASSDVDLLETTRMGGFSSDLYRQLDMLSIRIPALRERIEDIPMLVHSFLDRYSRHQGESDRSLSMKAVELLQLYPWPGNLRELWHVLDRFVVLREADELSNNGQRFSDKGIALCSPPRAVDEEADLPDYELVIASLLQTFSLRSQER